MDTTSFSLLISVTLRDKSCIEDSLEKIKENQFKRLTHAVECICNDLGKENENLLN